MRQFYLGKNSNGYYRVYFIDPLDEEEDPTRNSKYYDSIYEYLKRCGIKELNEN